MGRLASPAPGLAGSPGVTIVETLVAATLLGLAFVGTTSMLASGRDIETGDSLRRQAFRIAANAMEDTLFGPNRYNSALLTPGIHPRPDDSLKSEAGQRITATVWITVGPVSTVNFRDETGGFAPGRSVDYKKVEAKVKWTFVSRTDSVTLSKRIADIP